MVYSSCDFKYAIHITLSMKATVISILLLRAFDDFFLPL